MAFSAASWADGIDPRVTVKGGGGSTPITLANPNPIIMGTATHNVNCSSPTDACFYEVFQNQTPNTLSTITIALDDISGLVFSCGAAADISFFSNCNSSDNGHVTDIIFSGGTGILPAVQKCVPDNGIESIANAIDSDWCTDSWFKVTDPDAGEDLKYVGGEFAVLIDGAETGFNGKQVDGTLITPEPGVGALMLCGILALGLLKLGRRVVV